MATSLQYLGVVTSNIIERRHKCWIEALPSVPIELSWVEFESILKYYLYNGVYPINCLKYIIYIMRIYASLMQVKIRNTRCELGGVQIIRPR